MKKYLVFIFVVINAMPCFSQVKVTTNNNSEFFGIIVKNDSDTLSLVDSQFLGILLAKHNVVSIEEVKCTIENQNGDVFTGRIKSLDDKTITLNSDDGSVRLFEKNKITLLINGASSKKDSPAKSTYPTFGLSLITPGGINFVFGTYVTPKLEISCSAGFLPDAIYGFQANFLYNLEKTKSIDVNAGLCFGYSSLEDYKYDYFSSHYVNYNWTYAGLVFEMNYRGLFIQPGLSVGSGDFSNPQLLFQIGYVYRFND